MLLSFCTIFISVYYTARIKIRRNSVGSLLLQHHLGTAQSLSALCRGTSRRVVHRNRSIMDRYPFCGIRTRNLYSDIDINDIQFDDPYLNEAWRLTRDEMTRYMGDDFFRAQPTNLGTFYREPHQLFTGFHQAPPQVYPGYQRAPQQQFSGFHQQPQQAFTGFQRELHQEFTGLRREPSPYSSGFFQEQPRNYSEIFREVPPEYGNLHQMEPVQYNDILQEQQSLRAHPVQEEPPKYSPEQRVWVRPLSSLLSSPSTTTHSIPTIINGSVVPTPLASKDSLDEAPTYNIPPHEETNQSDDSFQEEQSLGADPPEKESPKYGHCPQQSVWGHPQSSLEQTLTSNVSPHKLPEYDISPQLEQSQYEDLPQEEQSVGTGSLKEEPSEDKVKVEPLPSLLPPSLSKGTTSHDILSIINDSNDSSGNGATQRISDLASQMIEMRDSISPQPSTKRSPQLVEDSLQAQEACQPSDMSKTKLKFSIPSLREKLLEKPYRCRYCKTVFARKCQVTKHKKTCNVRSLRRKYKENV